MAGVHWTVMSDVTPKAVDWLWEGRIPFGKVTLLDGEPGSGKSLMALDFAARVSRGAPMPLAKVRHPASNVVVFNDDDNLADTLRPRLQDAGADLSHVHVVDGEMTSADVAHLKPILIILDPLAGYLTLEPHVPPRQELKKLSHLARETGAAVLAVQYMPDGGFWAKEIYDAARSILDVTTVGHNRHRVALAKSNLKALGDVPPLLFHLDDDETGAIKITDWADSV